MNSSLAPALANPERTTGLGATLDVLAESLFFQRPLPAPLRLAGSRSLAVSRSLTVVSNVS